MWSKICQRSSLHKYSATSRTIASLWFICFGMLALFSSLGIVVLSHPTTTVGSTNNQIREENSIESRSLNSIIITEPLTIKAANNFPCENDKNCENIKDSMCWAKQCHCIVNYRIMNDTNGTYSCKQFDCEQDEQCQEWDENMICEQGNCICPDRYRFDEMDQKCHRLASNMSWFLVIALFPVIFVLFFCLSCIRLALSSSANRNNPYKTMN